MVWHHFALKGFWFYKCKVILISKDVNLKICGSRWRHAYQVWGGDT